MDLEELRSFCLSLPGVTDDFPFGEETLVFRVHGKIFLLNNITNYPITFNAKCDPERAIELRDRYHAITPGWHMNKQHWNTVCVDGSLPMSLVLSLIEDSWALIVRALPKAKREPLLAARDAQRANPQVP